MFLQLRTALSIARTWARLVPLGAASELHNQGSRPCVLSYILRALQVRIAATVPGLIQLHLVQGVGFLVLVPSS